MSVEPQQQSAPPPEQAPPKLVQWHRRVLGICFAVFAIEVGIFLFAIPWHPSWDLNWVPLRNSSLRPLWLNPFFRGAVSGVGLLNLYIGFAELGRQIRSFSRRGTKP